MTVSPASAMANTQSLVAPGSRTQRPGGNAHGAGHASPVSVGVGSGTKFSGNGTKATFQHRGLLSRRSFSLGDSSPFCFREGDTKASKSAKTEQHALCSSRTIR